MGTDLLPWRRWQRPGGCREAGRLGREACRWLSQNIFLTCLACLTWRQACCHACYVTHLADTLCLPPPGIPAEGRGGRGGEAGSVGGLCVMSVLHGMGMARAGVLPPAIHVDAAGEAHAPLRTRAWRGGAQRAAAARCLPRNAATTGASGVAPAGAAAGGTCTATTGNFLPPCAYCPAVPACPAFCLLLLYMLRALAGRVTTTRLCRRPLLPARRSSCEHLRSGGQSSGLAPLSISRCLPFAF